MKEFMIAKREALGLTRQEMAKRCECSEGLLTLIEEGERDITHPHIASRIAKEYGLDVEEYNRIVHESHRVNKLPKPVAPPADQNVYDKWRYGWGKKEGGAEEC